MIYHLITLLCLLTAKNMDIRPKSKPIVHDGITLEQLYRKTGHEKSVFVER